MPLPHDTFRAVKEQVSFERVMTHYHKPPTHGMVSCPFHSDERPSLKCYDGHGHCFSCGWHGDGIALVAAIFSLKPLEAARTIARDFGLSIDTRTPSRRASRDKTRQLAQRFDELAEKTYLQLAAVYRVVMLIADLPKTPADMERDELAQAFYWRSTLEWLLDHLDSGNFQEKMEALQFGRRWLSVNDPKTYFTKSANSEGNRNNAHPIGRTSARTFAG